jgi:RAB protein geranylgeranyltransferase component A
MPASRAAAKAGKSVLHLDAADYYGSHWASFQLDHFLGWARSQVAAQQSNGSAAPEEHATLHTASQSYASADSRQPEHQQWEEVPAEPLDGLYSNVEVHTAAEANLGPSREYNIDLAPRVRVHAALCCAPAALQHACHACGMSVS